MNNLFYIYLYIYFPEMMHNMFGLNIIILVYFYIYKSILIKN